MTDLGIFLQSDFTFDLQLDSGDFQGDGGLDTPIAISLFTDARITDEELPQLTTGKRGWWADMVAEIDGDQIGSKLWTLAREKRIPETLRKAEDFATQALQWMIDDGIAASITATAEFDPDKSGGAWYIQINIQKPDGTSSQYEALWES